MAAYPFLPHALARHLARHYGTAARTILDGAACLDDLGRQFGAGLTEREVRYLMTTEWARCAEDVLWRRTKLGLRISTDDAADLDAFMAAERENGAIAAE